MDEVAFIGNVKLSISYLNDFLYQDAMPNLNNKLDVVDFITQFKYSESPFMDIDQVCELRSLGFKWIQISMMLGISRATLYSKQMEAGISDEFKFFSTLIVHLHCSNNNEAETVLKDIKEAVHSYGLPLRVCSDMGGENMKVGKYMFGLNRSSVIVGSSVHNQQIERLWKDIQKECYHLKPTVFQHLTILMQWMLNPMVI